MIMCEKQLVIDTLRVLSSSIVAEERYAYAKAIEAIEKLPSIVCERERKPYVAERIRDKYGEAGLCPKCIHRMVCAVEDPSHPTYDCQYFDVVRPCERMERI